MRSVEDIRQTLATRKVELARRFHVKNLAVFGSYARDEQKAESDIDLLVEFDGPVGVEFIDLANYLEDLLQARVDLVSRNGIKPKYFRTIENDLKYV
jgi:predicted nucleotidyltransferase